MAFFFIVPMALMADGAGSNENIRFDIPELRADLALTRFAEQANLTLIVPFDKVRGKTANRLVGEYPLEEAIAILLAGTGLKPTFSKPLVLNIATDQASESEGNTMNAKKSVLAAIFGFFVGAGGVQNGVAEEGATDLKPAIEEVIVTAEKRAENLQDIPIAISAFSENAMEDAGVTGVSDLKQLAPSLQYGESGGQPFVTIRGIGAELSNIGAEAGVTVAQDGVPFAGLYLFNVDLFDTERVEVLRGPQGTIAGRNATGGAINIYSNRPTEEFESAVKVTVGNYGRFGTEGYLSGPVAGDKLLARLAVRTDRADGWLDNTFLGQDNNGADKMQGRLSLLSNLSENLQAYLILESRVDRANEITIVDFGRVRSDQPGFAEAQGVPGFDRGALQYQSEFPTGGKSEFYSGTLKVTWDINSSAQLVSTTGYVSSRAYTAGDFDGTIIDVSVFDYAAVNTWQVSQELTFTADLTDRLDMILGGLYMQANAKEPLLFGGPYVGLPRNSLDFRPDQDLTSYAVYTQWRYRFANTLRLSFGARYTYDTKELSEEDFIFGSPIHTQGKDSWGALTPRVALDYTPTDDLTLYASISRGFKAGGFNTYTLGTPNEFDPEFVWSYEAGLKGKWFDRRLQASLAGFYMDYEELQQSLIITPEGGGVPFQTVRNASAATIKGVELTFDAYLTDRFKVAMGGTWLDATFDELKSNDPVFPELGERDLAGNRLVRAPEFQFNVSGRYTVPLGNNWNGSIQADYVWQDQVFFSFYNHELNAQGAYGLLNVSAIVETEDGRWKLSLFGRNVLDERYVSHSYTYDSGGMHFVGEIGAPRIYGLRLAHQF